jgi:uncharacterized membrane protein
MAAAPGGAIHPIGMMPPARPPSRGGLGQWRCGMAVGAGLGALIGKVEKSGIDKQFQDQVRDMLKPGTSALFLVVEKVTPDKAVEGLRQFGGTVLKSSLSKDAEAQLQDALHGQEATA